VLPPPPKSQANYVQCNQVGDIVYVAGQLPMSVDGKLSTGIVGRDVTLEQAQDAAKLAALNFCSTLKNYLGDLDRVKKVVKVVGFVASDTSFTEHHLVINGFSNTMGEVFGPEVGPHARSAVGHNILPLNSCVEVEAIVQVTDAKAN